MTDLQNIYNFVQISDKLATAGQPRAEQLQVIKDAGYEIVINLANLDTKYDLPNEDELVKGLGMDYVHIPVVWSSPEPEDLHQFFATMDANSDKKVFVHCIANMRVSAFTMLYRVIKQHVPYEEAESAMLSIWNPEEVNPMWWDFIEVALRERGIVSGE
jgi:protein tyrosine phosphatase (PTP) superfamily phosphohydrolase (DUF442 family)